MDSASIRRGLADFEIFRNTLTACRYWDLPYNDFNYSYVDVATDYYKYCTLSYDRLGLGNSSHGDPVNEIQTQVEVQVLAELTGILREGKYPGAPHPFSKVTHVG